MIHHRESAKITAPEGHFPESWPAARLPVQVPGTKPISEQIKMKEALTPSLALVLLCTVGKILSLPEP